jgi:hypothetical protein
MIPTALSKLGRLSREEVHELGQMVRDTRSQPGAGAVHDWPFIPFPDGSYSPFRTAGSEFAAKLHEIVGLYVDPPDHAIVLSVDEKSQIQAFDRTQPGVPMKKGRAGTMTHDYKRHGVTTCSRRSMSLRARLLASA